MTKKQIKAEIKSEAKVYGSIDKGSRALCNQYPDYAGEINVIAIKMMADETVKKAGL